MRNVALIIVMVALAAGSPGAQKGPKRIKLPTAWKVGENFHYVLEKETRRAGWPRGRSKTPITLEVLERNENRFLFGWTYGRTQLVNANPKDRAFAERLANVMEGVCLRIRTDLTLARYRVENRSRAAKRIQEAVEHLADWMREQGMPRETTKAIQAEFKPLLTRRIASEAMMREPSILFMTLGQDYRVGRRYKVEGEIDNPFPGGPIPSPGVIWVKKYEPKKNQVTITWQQTVDPVKARKLIKASIIELARRMDGEVRPDAKFPTLRFKVTATAVIDTTTGLPITCRFESRRTVNKNVTVRRYGFRRSDGPVGE